LALACVVPLQDFVLQRGVPETLLQSLSLLHTVFPSWQNWLLHVPGVVGQPAFEVQEVPPCWQVPAIVVHCVLAVHVWPGGLLH
jgi:hypothetical protein